MFIDSSITPSLECPTVQDVIDLLSTFPPETPFRILDPDTDWTIWKIYYYLEDGKLWFTGDYLDMESANDNK